MSTIEFDDHRMQHLAELERTGALRLLIHLLEGPKHISSFIKRSADDSGIATQQALEKTRKVLEKLHLTEEYDQQVPMTGAIRRYVKLTAKGTRAAQVLRNVLDLLTD